MSTPPTPTPQTAPAPATPDFEKLGSFYLGKAYDLDAGRCRDDLILYDSRDLVTHAVCVGMTGSGKTGLCIGLLEEAAIDAIPAIVIDPKGDLSNLLLTFPDLKPEDFLPWVNADDAQRKGVDVATFARQQAALWTKGLAEWGEDGARIARLKQTADFTIYTPGSSAGVGVSVLKSFDPPPPEVLEDTESLRERISSTATGLLSLAGVSAEPNTSREHILVSTLLGDAWSGGGGGGGGRSLDLPGLIAAIQSPPIQRIGVMDLETFYPAKDRFTLALALNNLVAAPGFSRWLEGVPLDIASMLHTPQGKPRIAIFSIAHLNDAERMFFVSLLLNHSLGWVRTQSGTSSLRALLYMDEIAGYFPPVANPPSKGPLLTLMKQGRAFGFGVVLATQNPVDLDYKGLANAGTWFIGRLQTERDKARVLDGLEGAAANVAGGKGGFDRASVDKLLSRLGTRIFLMNNIHEDGPVVFETRWCLSYLRGPLTREQIRAISDSGLRIADGKTGAAAAPAGSASLSAIRNPPSALPPSPRPILPPGIPEYFIPTPTSRAQGPTTYSPVILGFAKITYTDAKAGIDTEVPAALMVRATDGPVAVDWDTAEPTDLTDADLERDPPTPTPTPTPNATFTPLPPEAAQPNNYTDWKKAFADALFRTQSLSLLRSPAFNLTSKPGESERDFRARLALLAREERDAAADKLRAKYAPRLAALEDRIRRAEQAVEVQKQQSTSAKVSTALSFGTAILGAFLGRKTFSAGNISKAATAARGVGRSAKESGDVGRAEDNVEALRQQHADLQLEFKSEVDAAAAKADAAAEQLDKIELKPRKTGINVRAVVLAWRPSDA